MSFPNWLAMFSELSQTQNVKDSFRSSLYQLFLSFHCSRLNWRTPNELQKFTPTEVSELMMLPAATMVLLYLLTP
jgi:hypothetical protein